MTDDFIVCLLIVAYLFFGEPPYIWAPRKPRRPWAAHFCCTETESWCW